MSIEAMKQALEALESATPKYTRQRADQKTLGGALDYWKLEQHQRLKAITSLRQAIAEAEKQEQGEPVAFKIYLPKAPRQDVNHGLLPWVYDQDPSSGNVASMWVTPVKTTPQQRTWVGLTDEEVVQCQQGNIYHFYRCIEAKLKEKNT